MAKRLANYENLVGFYIPVEQGPTNWTGLIPTGRILKTGEVEMVKEPSMTKQEFKAECDINNIVKEYQLSGQIKHINEQAAKGMYADLPDSVDFQESVNLVNAAQASFDSLPAHTRARFNNSAFEFLQFFNDPANQEEAIRLGLAVDNRPPQPAPEPDAPVPPSPAGKGAEGDGGKPSKGKAA